LLPKPLVKHFRPFLVSSHSTPLEKLAHRSFHLHSTIANDIVSHLNGTNVNVPEIGFRFLSTLSVRMDERLKGSARRAKSNLTTNSIPSWLDPHGFIKGDVLSLIDKETTAQVHPKLLSHALLGAALERSILSSFPTVSIQYNSKVTDIIKLPDGKFQLSVEKGTTRAVWGTCDVLIIANGAWGAPLLSKYLPKMNLGGFVGYSMVFRPKTPPTAHALFVECATQLAYSRLNLDH